MSFDEAGTSRGFVWDTNTLSWIKATPASGGSGGAITIADGADITQGSTADAAWSSGSGTVISLLKKIASAGGSAVSIADGANVVEGATADAAVVTDVAGTLSGKLRGLVKIFASVWDSANGRLKVDGSGVIQPVSGTVTATGPLTDTQLRASAVPVSSTTLALEAGGNLAAIKADVDKIPSQGQALAAGCTPVVLPAAQVTTLTPPAAITGFALDATLTGRTQKSQITDGTRDGTVKAASTLAVATDTAVVVAVRDAVAVTNANLDVALSTRLKPADTLAAVTTVGTITNPVTITPPTLTKGSQGATGLSVQDLRDAGRNTRIFMLDAITAAPVTEALATVVQWYGNAAVGGTTQPAVVPAGKTLRLTGYKIQYQSLATVGYAVVRIRVNTAGLVAIGSPMVASFESGTNSGATTAAVTGAVTTETGSFPEGLEIPAAAGIGFSVAGYGPTGTLTLEGGVRFEVHGYEY